MAATTARAHVGGDIYIRNRSGPRSCRGPPRKRGGLKSYQIGGMITIGLAHAMPDSWDQGIGTETVQPGWYINVVAMERTRYHGAERDEIIRLETIHGNMQMLDGCNGHTSVAAEGGGKC